MLQNTGLEVDSINANEEIGPFSEYGAKIPFEIILCQIIVYFVMAIGLLLVCKNSPKREPNQIAVEQDTFNIPKEVTEET